MTLAGKGCISWQSWRRGRSSGHCNPEQNPAEGWWISPISCPPCSQDLLQLVLYQKNEISLSSQIFSLDLCVFSSSKILNGCEQANRIDHRSYFLQGFAMLNCAWKRSLAPLTAPFLAPNQATLHFVDSKLDERCNPWMAMDENGTTNTKQLDLMILHMISVGFFEANYVHFSFGLRECNVMDPVVLSYLKHHPFLGHFVNSGRRAFCFEKRAGKCSELSPEACLHTAFRHQFVWPVEGCLL